MIRSLVAALALALLGVAPTPLPTAAPPAPVPPAATPAPAAPTPVGAPTIAPQPATAQEAHAHWPVEGASVAVQALLDRGVLMLYAFDVGEARVAFGKAIALDPHLALAYWGEAEADTIDINAPQSSEGDLRGAEAVAAGRRHLAHASPVEKMLIDAIALRYGHGSKEQRFARYADALDAWTRTHRDDANVLTVAAYARWNAEDTLSVHGAPTEKARAMLADLDDALELEPTNLGAHHLRIHLLEETHRAREAIPDAIALGSYAYPPGTSHLIHMPGHIWDRVGNYAQLVDDNERAVANDQAWFSQGDGPGQAYMRNYHDHDVDFVLYGLTTVGRDADALAFARHEDAAMQTRLAIRLHDDATAEREAPAEALLPRGIAAARLGERAQAQRFRARLADDAVAQELIDAALAQHAGDLAARVAAYAKAYVATKNDDPGDPKTYWATPVGEGYGAALLADHQPAQAEAVFAAELMRFPDDPHLEWGLAEARTAQGKDDPGARAAYRAHWKGSRDLTLADLG
ncbi:MAG TPA: hypothetical protein VMD91_04905 [Candidatus Sulfotelmatobacter sp.]|nr:hypothetical protein [Candidatus Sulfotelmatobacter sp.]